MSTTPRPRPCASCPYRRDVPSGVWDSSEYEKLLKYDPPETAPDGRPWRPGFEPSMSNDVSVFYCHQQDGYLCSGWVGCHDPHNLPGVMIGVINGRIDPSIYEYETDVPLFGSGLEAAEHGMKRIDEPGPDARAVMAKIKRKREAQQ